jgi:hypothetical protein
MTNLVDFLPGHGGRIIQHSQGRRSGDQFCIYIQDFFVIPQLIGKDYTPKKGYLDQLTKEFIQSRLTYRYLVVQTEDSDVEVRRMERELQRDMHGHGNPRLNGVPLHKPLRMDCRFVDIVISRHLNSDYWPRPAL